MSSLRHLPFAICHLAFDISYYVRHLAWSWSLVGHYSKSHLSFVICHLTFDIWHCRCHLTFVNGIINCQLSRHLRNCRNYGGSLFSKIAPPFQQLDLFHELVQGIDLCPMLLTIGKILHPLLLLFLTFPRARQRERVRVRVRVRARVRVRVCHMVAPYQTIQEKGRRA